MKKLYITVLIATLAGTLAKAQSLYNNGGTIFINTDAKVYVGGNLTNVASSIFSNKGILEIAGNSANDGILNSSTGSTISFKGITPLTISGTQPVLATNVTVNNAAGITLNAPLHVDGVFTFTNGIIDASNSSYPVVFGNAATLINVSDASHVKGYAVKVGTGPFTYPVGDGSKYQKTVVNATENATGIMVRYQGGDAGTGPFTTNGTEAAALDSYNNQEYWDIKPNSTATATVTLFWDDYKDINTTTLANRRVAHKIGANWLNEGGTATGTANLGSITSNAVSTFSPFAFGSVAIPATPIGLVATAGNTQSVLNWDANAEADLASYRIYGGTSTNPTTLLSTVTSGTTTYTHSGLTNGTLYYYRISSVNNAGNESPVSAEVTSKPKASQIITFESLADVTYGAADFDLGGTANSGLSVTYSSDDVSVATIVANKVHIVGKGTVNINAIQTGNESFLAAPTVTRSLNVLARSLTVSLVNTPAVTKVYDGTTTATLTSANYSLPGVLSGDVVTLNNPASGSYDTRQIGVGKTVTVTGLSISGANAVNYNLSSSVVSATIGTITTKDLTATLIGTISKIYDGTTTASLASTNYSLSGIEGSDMVSLVTPTTGTYNSKQVGSGKNITVTGLSIIGDDASNYSLSSSSVSGNVGSITVRSLTAALTGSISKVYDGTTAAALTSANYSLPGTLGDDVVSLNNPETGNYDTKLVGTGKMITVSSLSIDGVDASNYSLSSSSVSGNVGIITARQLTATLTGTISKIYDGTTTATLASTNYSLSGIEGSDMVSLVTPTAGTYNSKQVGSGKTITVTGLSIIGDDASNYSLSSSSVSGNVGSITVRSLTAALTGSISKVYDGTTAATLTSANYSLPGILGNDVVNLNNPETGNYDTKLVGTGKMITVSSLSISGDDASNYSLSSSSVSGNVGSITARQLTAALTGTVNKVYDGTTTATLTSANYSLSGILSGDVVTLNNPASGSYDTRQIGVGKTVTVTGLSIGGANAVNYSLSGTMISASIGTISPKNIILTLSNTPSITKTYDGLTSANLAAGNYTLEGIETGDVVTVNGIASYNTKDAGTNKTVTGTNFVLAGAQKDNYVLTTTSTATTGIITQKALTITADSYEKIQGLPMPTFTASYSGFITGESSSNLTSGPILTTTATTLSPQGTYPIAIGGAIAPNYAVTYKNGVLTVKPGYPTSITLTAQTLYENAASGTIAGRLSSTSDDPNATFNYSLVSGDGSTDNALFTISGNEIRTVVPLNFEQKSNYALRVRSTSQYNLWLEKEFIISINDVNEAPTLAAISNQTICFTTATQTIALNGISAGPEQGQETVLSVSSSNASLFDVLTVNGTGNTGTLNYRIKASAITGTATITVTVKDNGGTTNSGVDTYSRTFVITVNALPVVSISSDKGIKISKGETVLLTATGGSIYAWANADGIISGNNTATLMIRPRETTTYTVTVTNANGCTESKAITLTVLEDYVKIKATNIISPNGDGINDKWVIDNIDLYPNNEVKVFDKSGRFIYGKKGYDNSWEGTYNGMPLAEGTYYYIIDFGTNRRAFKGFITIVRPE